MPLLEEAEVENVVEKLERKGGAPAAGTGPSAEGVAAAYDRWFVPAYARGPFQPRSGKGARIVDANGKEYWDLLAGIAVNALGYRHPRLVKALKEEATALYHVSNLFHHPNSAALAEKLVPATGLSRVFFTNSGTEATEAALKLTRLVNPGRAKVVALENGFHGRTMGAVAITGNEPYRAPFRPLAPEGTFVPANDVAALDGAVTPDTAAIFLEPILGEGGIVTLTPEYLRAARRLADATGAVLAFDEIQTGFGRTGKMFAYQHAGVLPDLVTLAKPLGGGLPLGALVVGPRFEGVLRAGQHGTTFGGNPVACRLGLEVMDVLLTTSLVSDVAETGRWFGAKLKRAKKRTPAIVDVRGAGLMWGIELDRPVKPVNAALLEKGFVCGSSRENVIRLLPPLIVPRRALSAFVDALEETLQEQPT